MKNHRLNKWICKLTLQPAQRDQQEKPLRLARREGGMAHKRVTQSKKTKMHPPPASTEELDQVKPKHLKQSDSKDLSPSPRNQLSLKKANGTLILKLSTNVSKKIRKAMMFFKGAAQGATTET